MTAEFVLLTMVPKVKDSYHSLNWLVSDQAGNNCHSFLDFRELTVLRRANKTNLFREQMQVVPLGSFPKFCLIIFPKVSLIWEYDGHFLV